MYIPYICTTLLPVHQIFIYKKKLYTKKHSSGSGMVNVHSKYASDIYLEIYDEWQKGGDDTEDALSFRSFSAKEPYN